MCQNFVIKPPLFPFLQVLSVFKSKCLLEYAFANCQDANDICEKQVFLFCSQIEGKRVLRSGQSYDLCLTGVKTLHWVVWKDIPRQAIAIGANLISNQTNEKIYSL